MDFEKDIFISYAHNDNVSVNGDSNGWVTNFQQSLRTRLAQLSGKIINDSFDDRAGNNFFAPETEAQFQNLKIMICILTPHYVKSEWCRHEIDSFVFARARNSDLTVGNKSRIIRVLRLPVPTEDQSESIRSIPGYQFYKENVESNMITEFTRPEEAEHYRSILNDLAMDINQLIEKLN